jgi:hypothetical protein
LWPPTPQHRGAQPVKATCAACSYRWATTSCTAGTCCARR